MNTQMKNLMSLHKFLLEKKQRVKGDSIGYLPRISNIAFKPPI